MTDTRRRRYASKLNEMTAPQNNERSSYKISVSIADLNDENKYKKYFAGSKWRSFVLPEFSQNSDSGTEHSRVTYSRVDEYKSRSRTLTEIDGGFNAFSNYKS